ncbi:MAG: hypothetical protein QM601_06800 [Pseudoxanthomonas sp.]
MPATFRLPLAALLAAVLALPVLADETPEIQRPLGIAQVDGAVHTLRQIPEACTRLEGRFSGRRAAPYDMQVVAVGGVCQARAKFLDYAQARPSAQAGWRLNDIIRVPSASCPGLQAVVHVWRLPGAGAPPALDAQGRSRIYLEDAKAQAQAGQLAALPAYTAKLDVEGKPCGG